MDRQTDRQTGRLLMSPPVLSLVPVLSRQCPNSQYTPGTGRHWLLLRTLASSDNCRTHWPWPETRQLTFLAAFPFPSCKKETVCGIRHPGKQGVSLYKHTYIVLLDKQKHIRIKVNTTRISNCKYKILTWNMYTYAYSFMHIYERETNTDCR